MQVFVENCDNEKEKKFRTLEITTSQTDFYYYFCGGNKPHERWKQEADKQLYFVRKTTQEQTKKGKYTIF